MTRLWTTGFETGDPNEAGVTVPGGTTFSVVNSTPTPRAGSYCLKMAPTATSFGTAYKSFTLPSPKTDVWLRFAFFAHGLNVASETPIAALFEPTANLHTSLTYSSADGLLRSYRGTGTNLLGAASTAMAQDSWHVIEWRTQILTATTGTTEVWLDGNRVVNFSGDNSNAATLTIQTVYIGGNGSSNAANNSGAYMAFDDIAINDTVGTINNTRPGDGRVVLLVPNGAGSSTQFARGGTDTGANWSQVSEVPASMAQYVSSPTVGQRDLYALQNLGVAVTAINVVEVISLSQNSDAGAGSIGHTVKSGATTNEATAIGLATTAGFVTSRWELDPNTSAAWTAAAVDALEAGTTVR